MRGSKESRTSVKYTTTTEEEIELQKLIEVSQKLTKSKYGIEAWNRWQQYHNFEYLVNARFYIWKINNIGRGKFQ